MTVGDDVKMKTYFDIDVWAHCLARTMDGPPLVLMNFISRSPSEELLYYFERMFHRRKHGVNHSFAFGSPFD